MVNPDHSPQLTLAPRRPDGNTQLDLLKDQLKAMAETVRYIDESPKADLEDATSNAKIDVFRDFTRPSSSSSSPQQRPRA